jgi:hypothetical protein
MRKMSERFLQNPVVILLAALGATLVTVTSLHFKAMARGADSEAAPLLSQMAGYFFVFAACFFALATLDGFWRYAVIVVAASLGFAATMNGKEPILSWSYARNVALAFVVCIVICLLAVMLLYFGVDDDSLKWLTAPRHQR